MNQRAHDYQRLRQFALEGDQEAFTALVERFPALHLATEDLEYQPSITFRSLKALPVTWS